MSFANLSALGVVAGLLGLAGLLFLLQQLRIRYRELPVVTNLFWQQAVAPALARWLWQRFRHPLAYLLILAICALIWISLAEPVLDSSERDDRYVLLLDASAGMARDDRFERAVRKLLGDAAKLPASRKVVWVGASTMILLAPGEDPLLLGKRLEVLSPAASPSRLEAQLQHLAVVIPADQSTTVLIYGDTPVRQAVVDLLPSSMKVMRATELDMVSGNSGITALGIAEAASGAWGAVDVFVQVEKDADQKTILATPEITLDGERPDDIRTTAVGSGKTTLHDVPANGGMLVVTIPDDGLSLDNTARLRLPHRSAIQVQLSPSLDAETALVSLLALDPGIRITNDDVDVVIRRRGEEVGDPGIPALEFVPMAAQDAAFILFAAEDDDALAVQAEALQSLGLNQIDSSALASIARQPISVSIETGELRIVSVWQELLGVDYNFIRSRSFPLFITKSVRWLAQSEAWYPYAGAGHALEPSVGGKRTSLFSQDGNELDTIGVPVVPAQVGQLLNGAGAPALFVSLLDTLTTTGKLPLGEAELLTMFDEVFPPQLSPHTLVTWLLLLALLLLTLEWYLYQLGRIP